jgi:Flp pilus assembly protein TadD
MSSPKVFFGFASLLLLTPIGAHSLSRTQISSSERVQIAPPLIRAIEPPGPDATAAELEQRADQLRVSKLYLDALDYYRAALAKQPNDPHVLNKLGITEIMMQRFKEARKSLERSIRADRKSADAYNNLGVVYYEERKYGAAVKQYHKAIALDANAASFFSNLGAGAVAQSTRPCALRLHRSQTLCQDGRG